MKKRSDIYPTFSKRNLEKGINIFLRRIYLMKEAKQEEAQTRGTWKDHIVHILRGAAEEFYKCRLNDWLEANHIDRRHWELEWRFHLGERLLEQISKTTTFKDKKKAATEAFTAFMGENNSERVSAANTMAKYLDQSNIKLQKVLTKQDTTDFFQEVNAALNKHFKTIADKDFVFEKGTTEYPRETKDWNNKPRKKKNK